MTVGQDLLRLELGGPPEGGKKTTESEPKESASSEPAPKKEESKSEPPAPEKKPEAKETKPEPKKESPKSEPKKTDSKPAGTYFITVTRCHNCLVVASSHLEMLTELYSTCIWQP